MTPRKKGRVVLGTGYLWAMGKFPGRVKQVALCRENVGVGFKAIKFPPEWFSKSVPRIRLVAEIIPSKASRGGKGGRG